MIRYGLVALCMLPTVARAADVAPDPSPLITVYGRAANLIGKAAAASEGHVGEADLQTRPIQRVGELLEVVPGLIATQHSGSGKANQYFLRGFNLDHGTDFAGFLDGVPLNFRSHGHGQGYLDLNPIIPETVEFIDYRKGPYRADVGDFASAGVGMFKTWDAFPAPFVTVEGGTHDYARVLAGGSTAIGGGTGLAAVDYRYDDGPYRRPQDLQHVNAFGKWTGPLGGGTLRASAMAYHTRFDSSDQVPLRAIADGRIDRLGFVDPDVGGRTLRLGGTADWVADGDDPLHVLAYAHYYEFALVSNFTYFLDDPVDGDEFVQRDRRVVAGGRVDKPFALRLAGMPAEVRVGAETRLDFIPRVGLYHSKDGVVTAAVREDEVGEQSGAVFAEATLHPTATLRLLLGVRGDVFHFAVTSDDARNSGGETAGIVSPKASLAWAPVAAAELYLNYGRGYHSNDARGTTITIDPSTGDPAQKVDPLVRSEGEEVGVRLRPLPGLSLTATYWRLRLASELLFTGDGGTTEPQGPSRRRGTEFALFYQPAKWLTIDGEYTRSRARFSDVPAGADRIPGAIETVLAGGAVATLGDFTGSVRVRHFGSFAVTEDDSRRSRPTTVVNTRVACRFGRYDLALEVLNLLQARDDDITYFYTSRLPGEPLAGIDDYHVHPIEPRQLRLAATMRF